MAATPAEYQCYCHDSQLQQTVDFDVVDPTKFCQNVSKVEENEEGTVDDEGDDVTDDDDYCLDSGCPCPRNPCIAAHLLEGCEGWDIYYGPDFYDDADNGDDSDDEANDMKYREDLVRQNWRHRARGVKAAKAAKTATDTRRRAGAMRNRLSRAALHRANRFPSSEGEASE